jgi:lysophospholipase L1-like esterase
MRRIAARAVAAVSVTLAVLVGEAVWTVNRRLPASVGIDASGRVHGRHDGPPLTMVVLGDSTSTGPGLTDPEEIWFRQALAELDLPRPVEVVSLAVGGSRAVDVLERVDDAVATHPDIALVAVGSNDAIHGTPARRFEAQLEDLLAQLEAHLPVVAVANVGDLGNIARVPPPLKSVLRARSRTISRKIERVVERHDHAVLLDVSPSNAGFRDVTVFGPDLFHPNSAGHSLWAAAVAPTIRDLFHSLTHERPLDLGADLGADVGLEV